MGMEQFLASFRRGHNLPQLSTGHEDRLLPGSWTKDPSLPPAVVTRGLPVVPIPDTTTPPDKCYCIYGEYFSTKARLRLHVNGPHRSGTKHHVGLHFLARIGGAYVLFNTVTRAVILSGMARFPVQCGDVPSSNTCRVTHHPARADTHHPPPPVRTSPHHPHPHGLQVIHSGVSTPP